MRRIHQVDPPMGLLLSVCAVVCSYMPERRAREAQIRNQINQKMDEAGARERQARSQHTSSFAHGDLRDS